MRPNDGFPSARPLRIGVAAVAGVIVLVIGLAVGRATASGGSSPAPAIATPGPARDVPSWATGATRMDRGVPVGYAHTADGATNAARNYDLALSATPLALDPQAYRDAVNFLDVPSARQADAARIERSLAALAPLITAAHQGHPSRIVPFVLTTRLVSYQGDDAQVAVWAGAVFGADGAVTPQEVLAETTYTLRWLGDWRVVDDAGADGPGVKALTTPAQTNDLPAELGRGFKGVGDVAP
jgi:hypothetical protein